MELLLVGFIGYFGISFLLCIYHHFAPDHIKEEMNEDF